MRYSSIEINQYFEQIEENLKNYVIDFDVRKVYTSGDFFKAYIGLKNETEVAIDMIVKREENIIFTSGPLLQSDHENLYLKSIKNNYCSDGFYFTSYRLGNQTITAIYTEASGYEFLFLVPSEDLNRVLSEQSLPHIVVTDDKNYVLSYSGILVSDKLGKFYPNHGINSKYRIWELPLKYGNYNVRFLFPKSNQVLDLTMMIFLLVSSILIIIHSINKMAKQVGNEIQFSINNLISGAQSIKSGNYGKLINIETQDEMQVLVEAFNEMSLALQKTLAKNEELLEISKEAQIKQLEAQFNPHFLFNSLEALRYTTLSNPTKASDTLVSLSELLRYSLSSTTGSKVFLYEDMTQIDNYLNIHQLRLGDKFSYVIECDKNLYQERVPKLLIQPLIENSLNHAYKAKGYLNLKINVYDYVTKIAYVVKDDGPGMDQKTKDKIIESIRDREMNFNDGYGLKSVVYRLHLLYGEQSHFKIYSNENGTTILVTVPKERKAYES